MYYYFFTSLYLLSVFVYTLLSFFSLLSWPLPSWPFLFNSWLLILTFFLQLYILFWSHNNFKPHLFSSSFLSLLMCFFFLLACFFSPYLSCLSSPLLYSSLIKSSHFFCSLFCIFCSSRIFYYLRYIFFINTFIIYLLFSLFLLSCLLLSLSHFSPFFLPFSSIITCPNQAKFREDLYDIAKLFIDNFELLDHSDKFVALMTSREPQILKCLGKFLVSTDV